jgi:hypothetical protein
MGRIQGRNEGSVVVVVVVVGICNILSVFDRKLKNFGFCRLKLKKNKKLLSVKLVFFISTPPPSTSLPFVTALRASIVISPSIVISMRCNVGLLTTTQIYVP